MRCAREYCAGTILNQEDQYGFRLVCSACAREVASTFPEAPSAAPHAEFHQVTPPYIVRVHKAGRSEKRAWTTRNGYTPTQDYQFAVYAHREYVGQPWVIDGVYALQAMPFRIVGASDQAPLTSAIRAALREQHGITVAYLPWELVAI